MRTDSALSSSRGLVARLAAAALLLASVACQAASLTGTYAYGVIDDYAGPGIDASFEGRDPIFASGAAAYGTTVVAGSVDMSTGSLSAGAFDVGPAGREMFARASASLREEVYAPSSTTFGDIVGTLSVHFTSPSLYADPVHLANGQITAFARTFAAAGGAFHEGSFSAGTCGSEANCTVATSFDYWVHLPLQIHRTQTLDDGSVVGVVDILLDINVSTWGRAGVDMLNSTTATLELFSEDAYTASGVFPVAYVVAPEPTTNLLFAAGLVGLILIRKRLF